MTKYRLAVHGGAWNIPDSLWPDHKDGCQKAYEMGMAILARGGSADEAVAAAIRTMEDNPVFDAGCGSFLNEAGEVELDAGIMEGKTLRSGAVLGVSKIKNPIDLARHIMQESEHCIFMGEGAHREAIRAGFEILDPAVHIHEREREAYRRIKAGDTDLLDTAWTAKPHDTVGAIALDQNGNLAAGNSTGGILNKKVGRVGDAPLIGQGYYADNHLGAFVCTGWGESIMRSAMGFQALHSIPNLGPQEAARVAVAHLKSRVNGFGGILVMSPNGVCGVHHNTERMAYLFH